jgi:glycosyltransferase involved in cell wall biosynthesis
MPRLSVVIITFNEETNIARCIASVMDVADEILVVDSYSTDRTEEICREMGARFMQNKWEGYSRQKNYANSLALYDHILSIDADEALSEELRISILRLKENWKYDGYMMNRMTNYCGKWIRHGSWYPDRKLRLFDRTKGTWKGIIHETFDLYDKSNFGFIWGNLLHYSYYTISEHVRQANYFTDITAELAYNEGKKAGTLKLFFNPIIKFIRDYFFLLGFLDGYYGFIVSQISANATFLKYIKLRQLYRQTPSPSPES